MKERMNHIINKLQRKGDAEDKIAYSIWIHAHNREMPLHKRLTIADSLGIKDWDWCLTKSGNKRYVTIKFKVDGSGRSISYFVHTPATQKLTEEAKNEN